MSDFSRTYTRSKKKKSVVELGGDLGPVEPSGASNGPILRPRMSRASQPTVDEIMEEEEEGHETSSDHNESEENYRLQFRHGKEPTDDDDDDDDDDDEEKIMVVGKEVLKEKKKKRR
jgi:hypothetical protein